MKTRWNPLCASTPAWFIGFIGAVDDPNSNRQFQLEATVTKLK
jgi:hypothetical protein